jgi:hypothetical protein
MEWVTWLNDLIVDVVIWSLTVALAFGATLAAWLLQACTHLGQWIGGKLNSVRPAWPRPDPVLLGGAIFLFVMIGLPILAVLWGYTTGRLPAN